MAASLVRPRVEHLAGQLVGVGINPIHGDDPPLQRLRAGKIVGPVTREREQAQY